MEGKLVVSRKKKAVLVQELRDRKYEAFPRGESVKKARSTDEEMDNDEEDEDLESNEPGAGDYDYLLSVSCQPFASSINKSLTVLDAHLLPDFGAS